MHDHDDDLDFAMLTPPARPGPCKAATAPEVDGFEAKMDRASMESAVRNMDMPSPKHDPWCGLRGSKLPCGQASNRAALRGAVEVRHGSGKVKV
jgi:hypothetical protein